MDFSYLDEWLEDQTGAEQIEEVGTGYRNIWVVAELASGGLHATTLAALGQARELADQIGVYAYGVLLGPAQEAVEQELIACGADRVLVAGDPRLAEYQPEIYVKGLSDLIGQYRPEILLLAATPLGNDLAPRLAQRLNTGLLSHCTKLELDMSERLLLGTYPVLGGEVYHTGACPDARPQVATLEPGYYRVPQPDRSRTGTVQRADLDLEGTAATLAWKTLDAPVDLAPISMSKARIIVSAGRGMGDAAGFALVERLAAALGGAVAGSRGAFDEGWIAEEQIVGIAGQVVAPDLYIACGISGDIYHYSGFQGAKYVVAINPDEQAPIMKVANLAVVADARQVIPPLLSALAG